MKPGRPRGSVNLNCVTSTRKMAIRLNLIDKIPVERTYSLINSLENILVSYEMPGQKSCETHFEEPDIVRRKVKYKQLLKPLAIINLGLSGSNSYVREHDSQNRSNVTQHTSHCNCRPLTSEQNVTSGETYLQLGCLRCSDVESSMNCDIEHIRM
uniref:Uncharacterized protein n=1 Tax=Glossina pallidipes TaxID=7398 RepID=A0A1B0ADF3_GLOPL